MRRFTLLALVLLAGCEAKNDHALGHDRAPQLTALPPEALAGGATTVVELNPQLTQAAHALSQPAANLPTALKSAFAVGNSFFTLPWVSAPASTSGRDGLGPLYSAAACQDCHIRDGRGHPPQGPEQVVLAAVLRIGTQAGEAHPVYGAHLQTRALPGHAPEADVRLDWEAFTLTLPDGSTQAMRRPRFRAKNWGYGDPGAVRLSLRVAPPMVGLGLLEAIPDSDLAAYAAEQAQRWPQLSGQRAGRFGWKAAQPSVRQQALDAFAHDLGITSSLYPRDACTVAQTVCRDAVQGGQPELEARIEDAVVIYAQHLALPARRDAARPEVREGQALFERIGCGGCHRAQWRTGTHASTALSEQIIYPYTDLLLHDLGEDLADGLREGPAGPQDWRTAPLWALGQALTVGGPQAGYLHDGRAQTLPEAILWHGGEAQHARDAWAALAARERRLVLRFLASL